MNSDRGFADDERLETPVSLIAVTPSSVGEALDMMPDYFAELREPGTLLIVDDLPIQLESLKMEIDRIWKGKWRVIGAKDPADALAKLHGMAQPGSTLPNLVSVDLGLPPEKDKPWVGLKLLRDIRDSFGGLRLAVHSALEVEDEVLHTIMTVPASYVQVRETESVLAFAIMLPFLARGYLVYSATPAAQFPLAVSTEPDPLPKQDWELLSYIAMSTPHLTLEQISEELGVEPGRINQRVRDIATKRLAPYFIKFDESPATTTTPGRFRPKLEDFYNRYCARFGRCSTPKLKGEYR